jgi:tryptophanyl-tRNA synthetase
MKRILSGITPSGDGTLHIGNYLGAVKQFKQLEKDNDCFLFVADLHALTTIQDKGKLSKNIETLILSELALLGDLKNITFFRQSDVPMHTELQTILNNVTPLGLLKRAHAYKDKLGKDVGEEDINLGLFNYPILMASDILMYKPDLVPVGKDQKQHVEIARDVAERFNRIYKKDIFPLPDGFIPEEVATIAGTDGKRKMSKSLGNVISIFEPEDVIKKQVNSCYTDPTRAHATDPGHIEGNMVFTYLNFFGDPKKVKELENLYTKGKVGDVEIKEYLFESLMKTFTPARKRYEELRVNPKLVSDILKTGAEQARIVAKETMTGVREAIGLTTKYSFFTYPFRSHDAPITIDDFASIEMRVGKVTMAENVEKSEKLIRLHVDFAEYGLKTIFTGVRGYGYTPETFIGKQFFFVTNLQSRKMMGEESQGMIMATDGPDGKPVFVTAEGMSVGARIQ